MTARLRVLLVDDEVAILDGLRRTLRPLRDGWEVFTAGSGAEALALLEREPMQVIVSDMRMPGMDGAQLLEAVRQRHPAMARIVLSGQSDQEEVLRTAGPVHQYLDKPCGIAALRDAITRTCALRAALAAAAAALARAGVALPGPPDLHSSILACVRSREPTGACLGELVARDQVMAAEVLRLVNSALFGLGRAITSPVEAAALLGVESVRVLTLVTGVLAHSAGAGRGGVDPQRLWEHGLLVARLARAVAESAGQRPELCTTAFAAGLMHDYGRMLLAHHAPARYRLLPLGAALEASEDDERAHFGVSHAGVGGSLLANWDLPDGLIEAVVFHHRPGECPAAGFTALTAVHVAQGLAGAPGAAAPPLDHAYLDRLALGQRLGAWRDLAAAIAATAAP